MKKVCYLIIILFIHKFSIGQIFTKEDSIEIEKEFYFYQGLLPGALIGIYQNGEMVYSNLYGISNIETKDKITGDHKFYFSSLGKIFTSISVLKLVEMNKLSLEENLCEIFDDFPDFGKEIKVKNLLSHTSGLPKYKIEDVSSTEALYNFVISCDSLLFKPGTIWTYSNSDYSLLNMIIEKRSKHSYHKFLNKYILKKYKMSKNHFFNDLEDEKVIQGHNTLSAYSFELTTLNIDEITSNNAIYLTLEDYGKLDKLLFYDTGIENISSLYSRFKLNNDVLINYGFGLYVVEKKKDDENDETEDIYWIAGVDNGFSNILVHFPKHNRSILIVTNRNYGYNMLEKVLKIEDLIN